MPRGVARVRNGAKHGPTTQNLLGPAEDCAKDGYVSREVVSDEEGVNVGIPRITHDILYRGGCGSAGGP